MAPKTRTATWQPLTVKYDRPLVAVGNTKKIFPTAVRYASVGMQECLFLKLRNHEPWLVAGVSGYKEFKQIGGLTRWTSLVAVLKQALVNACAFRPITAAGSNEATTEAVSNEEALSDDEDLQAGFPQSPARRRKHYARRGNWKIRTRYYTNHCKGKVLQIEMPATAPEKDPTCTEKRMVSLFCKDRKTLWLVVDDAEWTMNYFQHQL